MGENNIQVHLQAIEEYIAQIQNSGSDLADIHIRKKQLSAIQKTIRQLDKNGIPIPESLNSEKLSLVNTIAQMETASGSCQKVYDAMIQMLFDLGRACQKLPHKDLYHLSRRWRSQSTPQSTLRKAALQVLKERGGTAHQDDIFQAVDKQLSGQWTPADLSCPGGKTLKWKNNLRRERKSMIREGILAKDAKGGTWTLAK